MRLKACVVENGARGALIWETASSCSPPSNQPPEHHRFLSLSVEIWCFIVCLVRPGSCCAGLPVSVTRQHPNFTVSPEIETQPTMFDSPDRPLGAFTGEMDPRQLTVPHDNSTKFSGETAGSSTSSEGVPEWDMEDLFDFSSFPSDHETDATSVSDAGSEGKPPAAPPAGSTADTTPHGNEDTPMTDAPLSNVWPSVSDDLPPRDSNFQLGIASSPPSPSPSTSTEMCFEEDPQPASPSGQKRTRKVKSAENTGHVRAMGACYCCKMKKTSVGALLALGIAPFCADWRP